jgi:hypothetical protein
VWGDQTLVEMGASSDPLANGLSNNSIIANSFYSDRYDASFVVLRGEGTQWGPGAVNTVIDDNVAVLTDSRSDGVVCGGTTCGVAIDQLWTVTDRNDLCAGNWALWSPDVQIRNSCSAGLGGGGPR